MDKFEQQLCRQSLNAPPTQWRAEILEAARQSRTGLQPVTECTAKVALFQEPTAQLAPASNTIEAGVLSSKFSSATEALRPPAKDKVKPCPTWLIRFREWFWPHPAAWASLAAIWLVLVSAHWQIEATVQAERIASHTDPREVLAAFAQRQQATERLLAGLDFDPAPVDGDRWKPVHRLPPASPPLMLLTT